MRSFSPSRISFALCTRGPASLVPRRRAIDAEPRESSHEPAGRSHGLPGRARYRMRSATRSRRARPSRDHSQAFHCWTPAHGSLRHPAHRLPVREEKHGSRPVVTERTVPPRDRIQRNERRYTRSHHSCDATRSQAGEETTKTTLASRKPRRRAVSAITHRACMLEPFNFTF